MVPAVTCWQLVGVRLQLDYFCDGFVAKFSRIAAQPNQKPLPLF